MLLPLHILESVDYYKHDVSLSGETDTVTLYFKSKWKFPKEITHNRIRKISEVNDNIVTLSPSPSTLELLSQLDTFLKNKYKLVYLTREQYIELLNFTLEHAESGFESYDNFIEFLQGFSEEKSRELTLPDNVIQFKPKD